MMCFGIGKPYVKPQPPRREKYQNQEEKYQKDYAKYEKDYEEYMNPENRRRMIANSNAGALAGTTAAIS